MLEKGLEGKTLHRLEKVKSLLAPNTLANAPILTRMKTVYTTVDNGVQVRGCNIEGCPLCVDTAMCAKVTLLPMRVCALCNVAQSSLHANFISG